MMPVNYKELIKQALEIDCCTHSANNKFTRSNYNTPRKEQSKQEIIKTEHLSKSKKIKLLSKNQY